MVFSASGFPSLSTGDFDEDGDIDGADFLAWQRNPVIGNLDNWQANYGFVNPITTNSAAVPEPSSLLLAALASLLFCLRRNGIR